MVRWKSTAKMTNIFSWRDGYWLERKDVSHGEEDEAEGSEESLSEV